MPSFLNQTKISNWMLPDAVGAKSLGTASAPLLGTVQAGILGFAVCASNNLSISGEIEVKRRKELPLPATLPSPTTLLGEVPLCES